MTQIRHPRFAKATRDVPESDAARWEASGWVRVEPPPEPDPPKPAKKTAARKSRARKKS